MDETSIPARPEPAILPIQPRVLALKFGHIETPSGVHTIIGRAVENPQACSRCPRGQCNPAGGFCIVQAPEYVPPELCAGYVLRPRAGQQAPGLGVERR